MIEYYDEFPVQMGACHTLTSDRNDELHRNIVDELHKIVEEVTGKVFRVKKTIGFIW